MTGTLFEGNVSIEMAESTTLTSGFFSVSFHPIYLNLSPHRKEV